ncbi:MAG TPA: condensation domain-containing protein, partial [Micromonosporaceae bacterium]|nr:condensation domain-containing protein [Micromonosporaceae bacterium]
YFPDGRYLAAVLEHGLRKLAPHGVLFLGDVRDLRHLPAFHAAVEIHQADPDQPWERVAWRVAQRSLRERELAVDPMLFWSNPGTRAVVLPHGGPAHTEMADYRYDVVLLPDAGVLPGAEQPSEPAGAVTIPWRDDVDVVAEAVAGLALGCPVVRLTDVPNERLRRDSARYDQLRAAGPHSVATVGDLRADAGHPAGWRPDDFTGLAARYGYRSEVFYRPDGPADAYDVVLTAAEVSARRTAEWYAVRAAAPPPADVVNVPALARLCAGLPEQLVAHAARTLPDYMVPHEVIVVAELPLSANGKVDRSRLPRPEPAGDQTRPAGRAPRTEYEHMLCAVWSGVLATDRPSVDDDFFRAGGDSLAAVRLVSAARTAGLRLRSNDLFAHPTIAALAELAAARALRDEDDDGDGELPALEPDPAGRFEPFPLTEIQQAYLLGRTGYFDLGNVPATFYVELEAADLDVPRLEAAFNGLVDRHDMLRMVVTDDGMQRVLPEVPHYEIRTLDCRGLDTHDAAARLASVRSELTDRIFGPSRWPLFEVRATRLDERRVRLHIAIDLMLVDGVSVNLILTELSERYADPGRVWPKVEVSFRDYQLAVEGLMGSGRFERARRYWLDRLDGLAAAPELPLAGALSAVSRPRFSRRSFGLDPAAWAGLRARASRRGLTPSAVLAAAYAVVL